MSTIKRKLEEEEQKRHIAESIAEEAGAIKECEFHSDTLLDQGDSSAVLK